MKINCLKKDLVKGIETVEDIVSMKNTLPILSSLLIETNKDSLHIVATDLEVGMECMVPAQIVESGGIAVPARKINEVIKSLPDTEININMENNILIIDYKKGIFRINGLEKESFPILPQIKTNNTILIEQTDLKRMIRKTSFAVSYDEARPAFNGILFVVDKDILRLVATDGKRMACIEGRIKNFCRERKEIIVPIKAINKLLKVLNKDDVNILIGENEISFQIKDEDRLVSRLINKKFPDYQKIIPGEYERRIRLKNKEFLDNLKRVSVLTGEKSGMVEFDILIDKMILKASVSDVGEVREEMDLKYEEPHSDTPLNIIFEPRYIMDFLRNEESVDIFLDLNGSLDPGVMKPDGDGNYIYIVMPIRP